MLTDDELELLRSSFSVVSVVTVTVVLSSSFSLWKARQDSIKQHNTSRTLPTRTFPLVDHKTHIRLLRRLASSGQLVKIGDGIGPLSNENVRFLELDRHVTVTCNKEHGLLATKKRKGVRTEARCYQGMMLFKTVLCYAELHASVHSKDSNNIHTKTDRKVLLP